MTPFDPYHIWLGIPETERPISKYRLLALTDFEDNRGVISAAAEQRTIYLRTLQSGEHEVLVAELLNEVSQARVTLLSADQKTAYDEELRKQQTPELESEPAREQDPLAVAAEELAAVVSKPATRSRSRSGGEKPFWKESWAIPAAAGGSVVLLLLMWLFSSGEEPKGSGQEQELQAEIALLKEKLVAAGNNKGEGNAELSQQNAELEAQIGDRSLDSSNVEGIPFELNSSESIKDPIFTYNLQGAYDGDIGMVLDPNKEIDLGKSWILRFTLTPPESPQKRRPFIVWGDSRPGLDALVISYGEGLLSFSVTDCNNRSGKGGRLPVDLKIGAEIDIELEYSSRSNTIAITADGDREEVQLDFTPALDRESPLYIGIIQGHPGRFVGTVANFQFGNIERPAKRNSGLPAFLKQGLVAYYPFNGNANDESGNGNHGTVQGANLAPDRYGAARSAYHFLRSADAIYAKAGKNLYPHSRNIVTYTLWFKLNSLIEPHFLSVCPDRNTKDGPNRFFVAATDREITMVNGDKTLPRFATTQFPLHTWQHMAVEYNYFNATAKAWHNGNLLGNRPLEVPSIPALPQSLRIGSLGGDPKNPDLLIDDVRIYNRSLSEAEVKSLYDFESKPSASSTPTASATESITNTMGMTLNKIPAGTFMMGSPEGEEGRQNDEHQHPVTISKAFYMQTTEVTQGQWKEVMGTEPLKGGRNVEEGTDYPAVYVSHDEAVEFCRKLSKQEAVEYRLPTEAEWEYACRAGTTTAYSFGDDQSKLGQYAWYQKNAWDIGEKYAHRVGQKLPNAWGLYDMHGNVWELCQDWATSYGEAKVVSDPVGPEDGERHLLRGAAFKYQPNYLRSAGKSSVPPSFHNLDFGFRLVRELD